MQTLCAGIGSDQIGMTITIDLPYIEVGFGAGHNEDLVLITQTGYELMHREEPSLIEL